VALRRPDTIAHMRLRTRLNLVVAALSAAFVIVLIAAEIQSMRGSVREEIEAANRVASHLLGRLASSYSATGGPDLVLQSLQQLGRVRANEVTILSPTGEALAAGDVQGRARGAGMVRAPACAAVGQRNFSASRGRATGDRSAALTLRARCLG
jgi:hypothetical protein